MADGWLHALRKVRMADEQDLKTHLHNQGQPGHFIPYLTTVSRGGLDSGVEGCENLK
jgi:hypothetical protein